MVVFTCNACSAVLKRNQVDKHSYQCRRCESLSCVDCGKDFWGDDYQQHIKCMTEEEKYCGKDNVPKVFKGEAKQEQWVEQVQAAIQSSATNPKLKYLLERLKEYSNIPRKKIKFENFVKNSLRVHNPSLVSEVWDALMPNKNENGQNKANGESDSKTSVTNGDSASLEQPDCQPNEDNIESSVPKSKRERKEERRKKAQKKEKKDKQQEEELPPKSKKRKRNESDDEENPSFENDECSGKKKKKNKKNRGEALNVIENENDDDAETESESRLKDDEVEDEEEEALPPPKKKKLKFNWEQVIKSVLEKKGEMTLKKLRKKVLNEFAAQDGANYSEDNLSAKFDKKVSKIEGVKVHKDRASLKTKR